MKFYNHNCIDELFGISSSRMSGSECESAYTDLYQSNDISYKTTNILKILSKFFSEISSWKIIKHCQTLNIGKSSNYISLLMRN